MNIIKAIKKLLKRETWNPIVPIRRKRPEREADFLRRIIRLAATRASMASWGQPFEAIASWMILREGRERKFPHK